METFSVMMIREIPPMPTDRLTLRTLLSQPFCRPDSVGGFCDSDTFSLWSLSRGSAIFLS